MVGYLCVRHWVPSPAPLKKMKMSSNGHLAGQEQGCQEPPTGPQHYLTLLGEARTRVGLTLLLGEL